MIALEPDERSRVLLSVSEEKSPPDLRSPNIPWTDVVAWDTLVHEFVPPTKHLIQAEH